MSAILIPAIRERPADGPSPEETLPPLEQGDRLTRAEFHRRYQAMRDVKRAELIEGIVHMPSPVKFSRHSRPHASLVGWISHYATFMPGVLLGDNGTVQLDANNELQPDAFLLLPPALGGRSRITAEDYVEGAPDLVVEIASSSASYDLHDKKNAYRRNGVGEYIVWVTREQRIEWWSLEDGRYVDQPVEEARLIKSRLFPGLWLEAQALLRGEMAEVLAVLQEGLASPEAVAFQARLAAEVARESR